MIKADSRPLIVHVVYRFGIGGLENGIVNLINGLPEGEFRHSVVALTSCDPHFCRRVQRDDVSFVSLNKPEGHGWRIFRPIWLLFRQHRPAIVHTRNLAALEMQLPAWAAGVKVRIHGEHGRDVSDPDGTNRRHRLFRRLWRPFVTRYVAVSPELEQYLVNGIGISNRCVTYICNGVDEKKFRPMADEDEDRASEKRRVTIGVVGRLQKIKGQHIVIDAIEQMVTRQPALRDSFRLQLVGDGPLRPELQRHAADLGLQDVVEFLGDRDDVPDLMRQFDLYVQPSLAEGISNTILEAMASGLAIVATTVGGNSELISDGETGLLVPPSNPVVMAEAIARYVKHPEIRREHGARGRAQVEARFTLSGMIERYRRFYHAALERSTWRALETSPH